MELFNDVLSVKEAKSLNLLIEGLKDVYRFEGSKHAVNKPNSVYDHIQGLVRLIDEIFKDLPIVYSKIRLDLVKSAYLHDAGEIFGELSVLDSILDQDASSNLRGGTKDCLERIFFEEAIAMGLSSLDNYSRNLQAKRVLMRVALLTAGTGKKADPEHAMPDLILACTERHNPKTKVSAKLMALYDESTYKSDLHKLFKPLDLIEGCIYYLNNHDQSQVVPADHIRRYSTYFAGEISKLNDYVFESEDYNTVKLFILTKAIETYNRYREVMATSLV